MEIKLLFIMTIFMYGSCDVAVTNESEIGKRAYNKPKYVKVSVQIEYPKKQQSTDKKNPESSDLVRFLL